MERTNGANVNELSEIIKSTPNQSFIQKMSMRFTMHLRVDVEVVIVLIILQFVRKAVCNRVSGLLCFNSFSRISF